MKNKKTTRREFLKFGTVGIASVAVLGGKGAAQTTSIMNLDEITVFELQNKMKAGELTSRRIVELYLEKIREIDPKIRSVLEINPDALTIADGLDKERKKGKIRSPLHGIPVLIKDNIETADRMKTTAGSLALIDAPVPKQDAFIVKRLRKAGAVILGKTNLSEWANFRSTKSISGWSGRGGQTNNPYILTENPCGSSAGTGAAISANLAAVGIGTETNGSIICPSSRNGLVGIKPTLGLVSRSGIIPIAHTQDTAGPMCRTIADAAVLLGALVGHDKNDSITSDSKKGEKDYTRFLDADGLRGARIGVARQFVGTNQKAKELFESNLEVLKSGGATLVEVNFAEDYAKLGDDRFNVLLYEFKTDLNKYLQTRGAKYKTLADLIKFNEENRGTEMPLFAQEIFLQTEAKGDLTEKAYTDALARIKTATREKGIDAVAEKDKLDALVAPAGGATWGIAAVAGYPYITVPSGFLNEMPLGFGFFGRAFSEPALIKIAYAFEQKTKLRRAPRFLPKAPNA